MVDRSPSKSPSLSPLSDSVTILEKRRASPQNEPLNLSRKMSATTATGSVSGTGTCTGTCTGSNSGNESSSSTEREQDTRYSSDSPSSQTANISASPSLSSLGNPPTPTDDPYDLENYEEDPDNYEDDRENYEDSQHPDNIIDPRTLVEQTRAALEGLQNREGGLPESILPDEEFEQVVPSGIGMSGDSVNLMDEINMQRAIIQSLGLQMDSPELEYPQYRPLSPRNRPPSPESRPASPERQPHNRPRSPSPQARKVARIMPSPSSNPLEPIIEISTEDQPPQTSMQSPLLRTNNPPLFHPLLRATPFPMQNPMLRSIFGSQVPPLPRLLGQPGLPDQPGEPGPPGQPGEPGQLGQPGEPVMALVPVQNPEGRAPMQLAIVRPSVMGVPIVPNPLPAHTGDGVFAGGSAQPYTLGKQYITICFVMPWGAKHYVRDLHSDHTMKDLLLFLQTYLRRYKDINWQRDIINLKMANPRRNLSKLPLKTKLRDADLGICPVIFVFHFQFLDRVP